MACNKDYTEGEYIVKTIVKKTVCMLLVCGLVFSGVCADTANASKKAKIKTKKVTMTVGEKSKIVIKNKNKKAVYKYTSSSKAKASVSKSGVIKAKKEGKVNITVKETYKKKTTKLGKVKVTIKAKEKEEANNTEPAPAQTVPATEPTVTPDAAASAEPQITAEPPKNTEEPEETAAPESEMEPISQYLGDENYESYPVPDGFDRKIAENEGEMVDITYDSTVIKEGEVVQRKAKVVLPKGYTEDKKYPVVYLCHGIGGNETSLPGDNVQNVVWNAIANGDAEEMIAVFPSCCANETNGPGSNPFFSVEHYKGYNNFLNDLKECLMPYINENYSTLTGREYTAIGGFSMGGRVTLHIGFELQDMFRYIGAFCPAPGIFDFTDNGVTDVGLFTKETFTLQDQYMDDTLVMIVKGGNDSVVKQFPMEYHEALKENGVPHIFYEVPGGGHDVGVYRPGMYNFFKRIFHKKQA